MYVPTADVGTRDEFVARFTNIYDALEVSDVKLVSRSVEPVSDNEYELKYTLALTSRLLGVLTYDYSADIVAGPQGYTVLYTPSLILPMLEEGDRVRSTQEGARGRFFSADGAVLAKNDYADSVYIDLERVRISRRSRPSLQRISAWMRKRSKKYDNAVKRATRSKCCFPYPKGTITDEQKEAVAAQTALGSTIPAFRPCGIIP